MTVTLLCFLLLTFAGVRPALGASASADAASIILGFKEPYGSPPKQHLGVDVAYLPGADLHAPVDGTISFLGRVPGSAGLNVTAITIEQPDGSLVTLNPFASTTIAKGDQVSKGQLLGVLSATGDPSSDAPHAHLSLRVSGVYRDPSALIAPALDSSAMMPVAPDPTPAPVAPVVPVPTPVPVVPTPAPAPVLAPTSAPAPLVVVAPSPSSAPASVPSVAPAAEPAVAPMLVQAPSSVPVPAEAPAAASVAPAPLVSPTVQVVTAHIQPAVPLLKRAQIFLRAQNTMVRFGILAAAAFALSAAIYGAVSAARRIPELVSSARELVSSSLHSAMRGVSMVSRTFLLRIAPSSSGATSPKEVKQ